MGALLHLKGWKIHQEIILKLGETVDLVLARNGQGKTALIDAIEFILQGTGKLAGVQKKGDLAKLLIHDDFDHCSGKLIFDDGWGVERDMGRDASQVIRIHQPGKKPLDGPLRMQQARIEEHLNLDEKKLLAVLDSRPLFMGTQAERLGVLFGATGQAATEKQILEAFDGLGLTGDDVQKAAENVTSAGWRTAEKVAGEARAAIGRELKAKVPPLIETLFRPTGSQTEFDISQWSTEDLEEKRQANQQAVDKCSRGEAIDVGAAQEALRQKKAQLDAAEGARDGLLEAGDEAKPIEELTAQTVEGATHLTEARDAAMVCASDVDQARQAVEEHGAFGAVEVPVVEKPETCTLIAGKPACPFSAAGLKRLQKQLDGEALGDGEAADQHATKLAELALALTTAGEQLTLTREQALQASEVFDGLKAARDGEADRLEKLTEVYESIDLLMNEVEAAEAKVSEAERTQPDSKIGFHQERLRKGLEMIDARRRYEQALKAQVTFDAEKVEIEDRHRRADQIAQALKASGIESKLLASIVAPLQAKLNEIGKHTGELRITEGLEIELFWAGRWRRWQQLSESCRERLAVAVQHAIASIAGFPMLVVDRVDHLDQVGKGALLRALVDVSTNYQAVLALATCQKPDPEAAQLAGVTTWFTEGGTGAARIGE